MNAKFIRFFNPFVFAAILFVAITALLPNFSASAATKWQALRGPMQQAATETPKFSQVEFLAKPTIFLFAEAQPIRKEPGATGTVIGTAEKGAQAMAVAIDKDSTYYLVRVKNTLNPTHLFGWTTGLGWNVSVPIDAVDVTPPPCTLTNKGVKMPEVVWFGKGQWAYDLLSTSCNLLVEGRQVETQEHHIWVLRSSQGTLEAATKYNVFTFIEGTVWGYPTKWNMEDFSTQKPPIAGEFVTKKVRNMKANAYSWPIFVHVSNGDVKQFAAGVEVKNVDLNDNADFGQPRQYSINGIYQPDDGSFRASIGSEGSVTVALYSYQGKTVIEIWHGARDNVTFDSGVLAYEFPSKWTDKEITDWINANIVPKAPEGTKVETVTLPAEYPTPEPTAEAGK